MPIINGTRAGLPAPLIHNVENNGGLGVNDVGEGAVAPVTVIVGPWDLFKDGDQAQILWGADKTIVARHDMSSSDSNKPVPVLVQPVDIRALGDGLHEVYVQVISALGQPLLSPPLSVRVKTQRPGGFDSNPDTETINENLATAATLPVKPEDDLANVRVVIAAYDNLAEGDRIRVSWHGQMVDFPPLTAGDLAKSKFEVPIAEKIIRAAGGGDVSITYRILDTVSNNSLWAPYLTKDVPIEDPDAPRAPWVERTLGEQGFVLRLADLNRQPVSVVAESHPGLAGEQIRVHWAGVAAGEQSLPPYDTDWKTLTRPGQSLTFEVPFEQAEVLGEGRVTVTYTLKLANDVEVRSKRRSLAIEGKASELALPQVKDTPGGILDAAKHLKGAILIAPRQPERIPAGSMVTFLWSGAVKDQSVGYADDANDTYGEMSYDQIKALVGGTVRIQYQVQNFSKGTNIVLAVSESDWITLDVIDSDAQAPTLPAPSVPQADANHVLDPDAVIAHLEIPPLSKGTHVQANIQAKKPFQRTLPIGDLSHPPTFSLTQDEFILPNVNSEASATYTVTGPGYSATSDPYTFTIGTVGIELAPPTVDQANGDQLDPFNAVNGITVRVPANAAIRPSDSVSVIWKDADDPIGQRGSWQTPTQPGNPNGMAFTVPSAVLAFNMGQQVEVTYSLEREGRSSVSSAAVGGASGGSPTEGVLPPG